MADLMRILSSNYMAVGSTPNSSHSKYVKVDPKSYQGIWSGTYANKQAFTLTISEVSGFRATVKYQSGAIIKYQNVLIKDQSFRIGDTKFTLIKAGVAQIKTALTNPATGRTTLATGNATLR